MADNINTPGVAVLKKGNIKSFLSYFDVHTYLFFRKHVILGILVG